MIKNNIQVYFVMTILILSASGMAQNRAFAATAPDLGTSIDYAVLAGSTITNIGDTVITGDLGISPSGLTSITGFNFSSSPGPGIVTGTVNAANTAAADAISDASDAYLALDAQACNNFSPWPGTTSVEISGLTFGPGVYCSNDTINLASNGVLTLNGSGVYIFNAGSSLTTVANSNVVLLNGATADNIFWINSASATIGKPTTPGQSTEFKGTVIAQTGTIAVSGSVESAFLDIEGRLFSLTQAVTFASITTVTVPTSGPTVAITSSSGSSGSTVGSTTLSYTATFSENVTGFILGDITVNGTANGGSPEASNFAGSGTTYTFDVLRGSSDGTVVVSIAANKAIDIDTNSNTASNTYTLTIDTISLLVTITSSSGLSDSIVDSTTLSYTATFSENVTGFILGDITVTGTANGGSPEASNFAGSGTTYTFDVLRGSSDGTVVVSIAANKATDIDGDSNIASNTYTLTIGNISHGGSSKEWATKPTFGISYQTNKQFVTDGFGYNVFAKTITDNFHTGFSMVNIPTDTSYPLYAKGYFANQLKTQEFCFGIPETGKGYLAESCIEVHFDSGSGDDRKITDVQVIQDSNVIDDVSVQHEMASCNTSDTAKVCDKTMITIAFAEPLQHSVMMIKGIDWKGKSTETYLNEGFNVNGKQLTDLPTAMIPGPTKYEGLIQVTQSEKYSNIWVSDDERMFERNSSGSFNQIKQTHERHQDTGDMKNRTHSAFAEWKDQQAIKAKNIWDSSKYVSTLAPSFAYDYPVEDSRTAFLNAHSMLEFARGQ